MAQWVSTIHLRLDLSRRLARLLAEARNGKLEIREDRQQELLGLSSFVVFRPADPDPLDDHRVVRLTCDLSDEALAVLRGCVMHPLAGPRPEVE